MLVTTCYFDSDECAGDLWQCQTCGEWFCQTHFHVTAKGRNVECVAFEANEKDFRRDYPNGEYPPAAG